MSDAQDHLPPPSRRGSRRARTLLLTGTVLVILGAGAVAAERRVAARMHEEAVATLRARLAGHASALELALAQRAGLLNSMAAWIKEEGGGAGGAYRRFLGSLHDLDPGVRALQMVVSGRIVESYPEEGNEGVLGFDLRTHTDTQVVTGLLRALDREGISLTAPVTLIQGGTGVILRRSAGDPGDRDAPSASMVVDVGTLMHEAGFAELMQDLHVGVRAASGTVLFGTPPAPEDDPVELPVVVPEGTWSLVAAPAQGWPSLRMGDLRSVRGTLLLILVLGALLAYALVDRDSRLQAAVEGRTEQLTQANRRLEAAAGDLAEREKRLTAALKAGRVLTWAWDVRTGEVWAGGSETSLGPRPGKVRQHIDTVVAGAHPEDRPGVVQALDEARRTGRLGHEYRVLDEHGHCLWVRAEGDCSERDEEGPLRIIGATADISRVKELEGELLHSGRLELVGQLAGGVAHDLNNALAVVRAELELGLDDAAPDDHLAPSAVRALEATQYAALLIGQLLTFARKDRVNATTFEWDAMCREVGGFLSRLLGRTVAMSLELNAPSARVHMDRAHAMQILTNLAVNARDAMDGQGTLTLATYTTEEGSRVVAAARDVPSVVVEVRDTGSGIPDELRARIFEPFFTTKGADRGTGLGLSTTLRIVRDNGGGIDFRSSRDGTTFLVVIPLAGTPGGEDAAGRADPVSAPLGATHA